MMSYFGGKKNARSIEDYKMTIETYKILTGVDKANKHQLLKLENQDLTRAHEEVIHLR